MSQTIPTITFISTIHKETGMCNADELCVILEIVKPDVVFLEALEDTYSKYDVIRFSKFEVYHDKLEIKALQKYGQANPFDYVPVLNDGLSEHFDEKYSSLGEYNETQEIADNYNSIASEKGFSFLNSTGSIDVQRHMRMLESSLLNNSKLDDLVTKSIGIYEDSMLQNIYSYCSENQFETAVFLCGVAHRSSIIEKIELYKSQEELDLNWIVFGD